MEVQWEEFKNFVDGRGCSIQFIEMGGNYCMEAFSGNFKVSCQITTDPSNAETAEFNSTYKPSANAPLVATTGSGVPKVAAYEPEGSSTTIVSHNFTDKCSWYQGSVKVTAETLSTSDDLTFTSAKTHWIDLENGRLYDEDNIMLSCGNEYKPKIYVNGTIQTSGYTVNPVNGSVTFSSSQAGNAVTATYYYADKSWYIIRPKEGKILSIKTAEVQFCSDTVLNGAFLFEPWFNHPVYGWIAVPGGKISYKNFKDFISACNGGQGLIPAIGDVTSDVHVFPFNYARPRPVKYSDNVEIRVYVQNHVPAGGQYATATFYVTIEDE
jgi:hypothetical protein